MMKRTVAVLPVMIVCMALLAVSTASASEGDVIPLAVLEREVTCSPQALQVAASVAESVALEERQRAENGPRWFANISLSGNREPLEHRSGTDDEWYSALSVQAGVQIPLFGTWRKERIKELEAGIRTLDEQRRLSVLKKANLIALRKAYILLWTNQRKQVFLDRFLRLEPQLLPLLEARTKSGFLLERDRLEMESWFSSARRELSSSVLLCEEAMRVVRKATGRGALLELTATPPHLPDIPYSKDLLPRYILEEAAGELSLLDRVIHKKEEIVRHAPKSQYEAFIRAGVGFYREYPGGDGSNVFITLGFDVPWGEAKAAAAAYRASQASAEWSRQEKEIRRGDLLSDIMEGVARYDRGRSDREFALTRLRSAAEGVREGRLRHSSLPGDTLEQLFRNIFDYLSASMSLIESEGMVLQTHAELLGAVPTPESGHEKADRVISSVFPENDRAFSPSWIALEEDRDPSKGNDTRNIRPSLYLWSGDTLLSDEAGSILRSVQDAGFSRVLVSFTGKGITMLKNQAVRKGFEKNLSTAKENGLSVELLLGDPSWILPGHRKELLSLVSDLSSLNFSGLHLDLEPDQIAGSEHRRKELLKDLIDTVQAVSAISPWPLGLSVHPRYLEGDLGPIAVRGFAQAKVREVTVMVYATNIETVTRRMKAIGKQWPALRHSLAISVEKKLPPSESFFSRGTHGVRSVIQTIQHQLSSLVFAGIVVQAWEDYKEMSR